MFDRLKRDLGIRAILALTLVCAAVVFVGISMYIDKEVPEVFMSMVGMAIAFYFSNRTTMDKQ